MIYLTSKQKPKYLKTIEKLAKINGVSLTEFQINNDLLTTMVSEIHRKNESAPFTCVAVAMTM